jgi:hypothetical protein
VNSLVYYYLLELRVSYRCGHDIPDCWKFFKCPVSEAATAETLTKFGLGMEWGECVSQVTAVQRQLREKQAWLQMLRALQPTNWSTNISPVVDDIDAAHESYMECWVNAASEKLIRWLLYLGIPRFTSWCQPPCAQ